MTYRAIVEDRQTEGFQASLVGWPGFTAVGSTREEALAKLRREFRQRFARVEVVPLEMDVSEEDHPLARFAGMFEDDPLFDQFVEDMKTYRRELEEKTD